MTHDDIQSLLGAYALDAVEGAERDEIAAHLETCDACREELAQFYEAASLMALAESDAAITPPRESLWHSIEQSLSAPIASLDARRSHRDRRTRLVALLASAAAASLLVVAISSFVQINHLNHQLAASTQAINNARVEGELANAVLDGQHRAVNLNTARGSLIALAVVSTHGRSFFVNHSLRATNDALTYQLWAVDGGRVVSLGVLGSNPHIVEFTYKSSMTQVMVNIEPHGGTSTPTTPVIAGGVFT